MKRNNKRKYPAEAIVMGILVFAAVIMIVSIIFIEENKKSPDIITLWQNIALSILCSVVASFIFVLIQNAFARQEDRELRKQLDVIEQSLKLQNELYDSGIKSIHPKAHFDDEEEFWNNILRNTENRMDLIGHSISNWFKPEYREQFCGKISQMISQEKEVNIILSANDFSVDRVKKAFWGNVELKSLNKTEKTVYYFLNLVHDIEEGKRKNLKVYVTNRSKITYLYIKTDYQCIISPYILSSTNNQNSFLLELKEGSKYAKAFADDFREMTEGLDCLDWNMHWEKEEKHMRLLKTVGTENQYSGSSWNSEKTEKFVFEQDGAKYEVGYFEHYLDSCFVKAVIELPVSFGCPSHCRFCASSAINEFVQLTADQMLKMFQYVYTLKNLEENDYILLTMTGTGDLTFNFHETAKFLTGLTAYSNLHITVSSCLWNDHLLKRFESLEKLPDIRNIQITYVSDKKDTLKKVIPIYESVELDFESILAYIRKSGNTYYRINYILIRGINDSEGDFLRFRDMLADIKGKVVVRISKLNETGATKRNSLYPAEPEAMEQLNEVLTSCGIRSYMFYSKRNDNMNCGQLITERE